MPQRAAEDERLLSLLTGKVAIARAHRQAIRFAQGGANHQLQIEVQIAHHAPQHRDLGRIFLSEESLVGLDDVEQFRHDRRHAAKMPRARRAVQTIRDSLDLNHGACASRIHLRRIRREKNIDTFRFEQRGIRFECARILREILPGSELRWVYENRRHHSRAGRFRSPYQGKMACVQSAHGRHEADRALFHAESIDGRPRLGDGSHDLHGAVGIAQPFARRADPSRAEATSLER